MPRYPFTLITEEMLAEAQRLIPATRVRRTIASRIDTLTGHLGEFVFAKYLYQDWQKHRVGQNRGESDFEDIEIKTSAFPFNEKLNLLVREDYAKKRKPAYYVQIIIDVDTRTASEIPPGTRAYVCGYATASEVDAAPKRDFGSKFGGDGGYHCHHIRIDKLHPIELFAETYKKYKSPELALQGVPEERSHIMSIEKLFQDPLKVINIGLPGLKKGLDDTNTSAIQLNWQPSAEVSDTARNQIDAHRAKIERANQQAMEKILNGMPHLTGLSTALEVIPGMHKQLFLHAGPPVSWERMCGPMRGAVIGGLIYEGLAKTPAEAEKLGASGEIEYAPCHQHQSVGPMAGLITPSMPVFIVENQASGNQAFCTLNEGLGKVLRYGAFSEAVIEKLRWMEKVLYPALQKAVAKHGSIDLKNLIAQALHMGDEVHNRNRAATSLFYRTIAPAIVETAPDRKTAADVLGFINGNDHFFLNLSMPACKAMLDAARGVPNSSVLTVMARNGTDFGIQLAGTGDQWFSGPAALPDALFFPGYSKADANPDIGDSAITETGGLGGFAIAASPAIVQFVGGSANDAVNYSLKMYEISAAENNVFQIPYLNFRGTPTGIDAIQVVEKNILPFIDTGVAHKDPGVGQIGAGVLNAPMRPFQKAYEGLAEKL